LEKLHELAEESSSGLIPFRHGVGDELAQFSTVRPGTPAKSPSPLTTMQLPRLKAMAAI
jgi:hypothetical protein